MELPQSRPYGTQGRKPTHNFLSLYSPAHQDPSSNPPGGFLETHDFMHPLERFEKNIVAEGNEFEEPEHMLPRGKGTYNSISHSSCVSQSQKNPSFVDMLKSAKSGQEDEDDEEQEFVIKKEPSSHYKDTTHHDQKANTPRSKHSATEQRRRSKINDRFSKLRELIPHGDQKRDKASFLSEVIEYVRSLQEKALKYEDSCRNINNNNSNNQRRTEGFINRPLVNKDNVSLNHPKTSQTNERHGQPPCLTNKGSYTNDCTSSDKLKDEEVSIESGTISISTIYSQGLLSTLTQALQNSGVDLSQANISVQIDLGKRANSSTPILKKSECSGNDDTLSRSRLVSTRDEKGDKALKRVKTNMD